MQATNTQWLNKIIKVETALYKYVVLKVDRRKFSELMNEINATDKEAKIDAPQNELHKILTKQETAAYEEYKRAVLNAFNELGDDFNTIAISIDKIRNGVMYLFKCHLISQRDIDEYIKYAFWEIDDLKYFYFKGIENE
ncbi:hypothetical protein [Mycoplasma seminis]|uniref:Uncharacterized protein n=1 Tax=Mycoplasma seminis TaxID=512749 RepID=A0ABY9H9K9_9MOLU|nr:hypothetical protein [Mycoplasma seminis]WLP85264.1 hypothetical protein Q8852_02995 [Mycoplasma seminis]